MVSLLVWIAAGMVRGSAHPEIVVLGRSELCKAVSWKAVRPVGAAASFLETEFEY